MEQLVNTDRFDRGSRHTDSWRARACGQSLLPCLKAGVDHL
jgi:hypothetical protein